MVFIEGVDSLANKSEYRSLSNVSGALVSPKASLT